MIRQLGVLLVLGRPLEATVVPTAFNTTRETELAVGFCLVAFELVRTSAINSTGALSAGRYLTCLVLQVRQPDRDRKGRLPVRLAAGVFSGTGVAMSRRRAQMSKIKRATYESRSEKREWRSLQKEEEQKRGSLSPQEW